MLCTSCRRREASVFIEHTVGSKCEKMALCESCAEKSKDKEGEIGRRRSSDLLLSSLIADTCSGEVCPVCSSGIKDIVANGRARCATCYTVFAPELSSLISALHGSSVHTGGAPKKYAERKDRERQLIILRAKLEHEIKEENFEVCAALRDEIALLLGASKEVGENAVV